MRLTINNASSISDATRRDVTLPSGRSDADPRVSVVSCRLVIASGLICDGPGGLKHME